MTSRINFASLPHENVEDWLLRNHLGITVEQVRFDSWCATLHGVQTELYAGWFQLEATADSSEGALAKLLQDAAGRWFRKPTSGGWFKRFLERQTGFPGGQLLRAPVLRS